MVSVCRNGSQVCHLLSLQESGSGHIWDLHFFYRAAYTVNADDSELTDSQLLEFVEAVDLSKDVLDELERPFVAGRQTTCSKPCFTNRGCASCFRYLIVVNSKLLYAGYRENRAVSFCSQLVCLLVML